MNPTKLLSQTTNDILDISDRDILILDFSFNFCFC